MQTDRSCFTESSHARPRKQIQQVTRRLALCGRDSRARGTHRPSWCVWFRHQQKCFLSQNTHDVDITRHTDKMTRSALLNVNKIV